MAVQKRNDELVDILTADFPRKDNPAGYWHGHTMKAPAGFDLVIPADICHAVARFEIEDGASVEIENTGAMVLIG